MAGTPARPVVVRAHESSPQLCYLDIAPDLNSAMGRFTPARLIGRPGRAYLLAEIHLEPFRRFAQRHGWALIDERGMPAPEGAGTRPPGRDRPLPECWHCGQPARRGSHLRHCPNCGRPWRAVEPIDSSRPDVLRADCPACGAIQPAGFAHCGTCGNAMPSRARGGSLQRSSPLQEPLPIGEVVVELVHAGQLPSAGPS